MYELIRKIRFEKINSKGRIDIYTYKKYIISISYIGELKIKKDDEVILYSCYWNNDNMIESLKILFFHELRQRKIDNLLNGHS